MFDKDMASAHLSRNGSRRSALRRRLTLWSATKPKPHVLGARPELYTRAFSDYKWLKRLNLLSTYSRGPSAQVDQIKLSMFAVKCDGSVELSNVRRVRENNVNCSGLSLAVSNKQVAPIRRKRNFADPLVALLSVNV
jgi:hypothetical protein